MQNCQLGSIYYYESAGAINNGNPAHIDKIGLFVSNTATGVLDVTVSGTSVLHFAFASQPIAPYHEFPFGGTVFENASIATITAGTAWVYIK